METSSEVKYGESRYWEMFQMVLDGHTHTHPSADHRVDGVSRREGWRGHKMEV